MKIAVLASGSKGNSTYIEENNTRILIDLGISTNYVEKKLSEIGVNPRSIDGILITHVHNDHIAGIKTFCKKYNTKLYVTPKMEKELQKNDSIYDVVYIRKEMNIKEMKIKVIKNSHDIESYGFIINEKMVYITDTGYLNTKYFEMLYNKDIYVIESNHDTEMLQNSKYPHYLKQRIWSDKGHLSNSDCSYYLSKLIGNNTKYVVLAHLSEENNTKEKALEALIGNEIDKKISNIIVAEQKERTELMEV